MLVECAENAPLDLDALNDRFDDTVGVAQVPKIGGCADAASGGVRFLLAEPAAVDIALQRGAEAADAALQQLVGHVADDDFHPVLRANLRDAAAHRAAADHAEDSHEFRPSPQPSPRGRGGMA